MIKPERKVVLDLTIQGDSWDDIIDTLDRITFRIHEGPITSIVSGGYSSGYIATGKENEGQTGDNYRKQNNEYVKQLRGLK